MKLPHLLLFQSKPASSPIEQPVNADDFFKDMGRKPKPKKVDFNIESPEITGLREAPLPPAPKALCKTLTQMQFLPTD
ncbi:MAG: hypothetical protein L6V87_00170 [Ruminococcus sp.]|nr:MAG: hypothetical protein L6V87_00170 [Ruminococcus sp.]